VVEPGDLPAVGADVPGVIEGVIDGPSGPLRNWPFRLLRNGKPVTDLELGREGSCANQFKRDCWWTDCAGRYRFERMMGDSYSIEVL